MLGMKRVISIVLGCLDDCFDSVVVVVLLSTLELDAVINSPQRKVVGIQNKKSFITSIRRTCVMLLLLKIKVAAFFCLFALGSSFFERLN